MWIYYSAIQAALELKRTCRRCGTRQVVRLRDKRRAVACTRCGESIAAP